MLTITILVLLSQQPRDVADKITDPGWPANAARIFNYPGRIAWREQSGRWSSDYSGRPPADVLADFARLVPSKRIVLHEPHETLGWSFTAWQIDAWERAPGLAISPVKFGESIAQLDIYGDTPLPEGIEVVDRRMHGHPAGNVIEGRLTDLEGHPLAGKVILQDIFNCRSGPETVTQTSSDTLGRWVLRHPTPSTFRVVAESEGFVPRVIGQVTLDDEPQWKSMRGVLARPVTISGRVTDESGRPLEGARVNIHELTLTSGAIYESPEGFVPTADEDGRFSERVPAGKATLWPYVSGWCRPGPGLPVTTPSSGIELRMIRTSEVRVTVEFPGKAVGSYRVSIEPEGEKVIGMHEQWAHTTRNQMRFSDVQPGRYIIRGRPDPGEGGEVSTSIELESGKKSDVTLKAK